MCQELTNIYDRKWFRDRFGYSGPYHRFTEATLEVLEPAAGRPPAHRRLPLGGAQRDGVPEG